MAISGMVYPAACGSLPWWCRPSDVGRARAVVGESMVPRREKRMHAGWMASAELVGS